MPETFTADGLELMYPETWRVAERGEQEPNGASFDLPGGGFVTIDQIDGDDEDLVDTWFKQNRTTIVDDYGDLESEPITGGVPGLYRGVDYVFYYLDLIITSRCLILLGEDRDWAVQIQAESRDFETNEPVFSAILHQVVPKPT